MSEERGVGLFVQDMLESIEKIESYLASMDTDGFEEDSPARCGVPSFRDNW